MPSVAGYVQDIKQAMSIKFNNLVYEMKGRGEDVIVLSLGEAYFDIPLQPFEDLPFPDIYHYSHSRGLPGLRRRLANYYAEHYGVPVDFEKEILITAGSKIAIHMSFMAMLRPGDEVIVPEPAWVSYTEQIKLCHGVPVLVPYDTPVQEYSRFVTNRTKALVLCNPHNPRGSVYSAEELSYLHKLADSSDLFLLADEAYSDFLMGEDRFQSAAFSDSAKRHTVICNSMSKNYGLSGWRIGYVIANSEFIFQVLKINQHLITCPATILEHYLERYFDRIIEITTPQIESVVQKRKQVAEYMKSMGISFLPGSATFYLFVSLGESKLNSEEFATRLLLEHKISTVPGAGYGASCDRFIRVSVGTESMERTFHGIDKIRDQIRETSA